jgi:hypothetical protein
MGTGTGLRATSQTPNSSQPDTPIPATGTCRTSMRSFTKTLNPAEREKARIDAVKEIITVDDAMAKLVSREFSVPDQEYLITHLALILFQITATLPAEGASIVKAVAILVNELDLDNHAKHMADALMTSLRDPLQEFVESSATVQSHVNCVIEGHDSIENCVIKMVTRIDKLQDAFRDTQEKAKANNSAVQDLIATLDKRLPISDSQPAPSQTNDHVSSRRMTKTDHVHQGTRHDFAMP